MTNREWLNSLTDDEFIEVCGNSSLCSRISLYDCNSEPYCMTCLKKWLSAEHIEKQRCEE
jgi:hypothetical protein